MLVVIGIVVSILHLFRILMISGFCLLGISCHYHAMIGKSDLKTISQECIEESDTENFFY